MTKVLKQKQEKKKTSSRPSPQFPHTPKKQPPSSSNGWITVNVTQAPQVKTFPSWSLRRWGRWGRFQRVRVVRSAGKMLMVSPPSRTNRWLWSSGSPRNLWQPLSQKKPTNTDPDTPPAPRPRSTLGIPSQHAEAHSLWSHCEGRALRGLDCAGMGLWARLKGGSGVFYSCFISWSAC